MEEPYELFLQIYSVPNSKTIKNFIFFKYKLTWL